MTFSFDRKRSPDIFVDVGFLRMMRWKDRRFAIQKGRFCWRVLHIGHWEIGLITRKHTR